MDARVAWVLNLDADFELAFGLGYAPKKSVQDAYKPHARALALVLTRYGDVIVDEATPPDVARGLAGRAFCATPRALAMLRRAGAEPEPHPSFEVLRRVNSRAFCQALGGTMPNASFESNPARAEAKLRSDPGIADAWRVKRSFGVAGRGQRVVRPGEDIAFLKAWMDEGGAQIEPNVDVIGEYAIHGVVAEDGVASVGNLVMQTCDAAGAWLASASVSSVDPAVEIALRAQANLVAPALHIAGYFGPFGIDAFQFRGRDGQLHLQPRSEINARYTMGFAHGFSARLRAR